MLLGSQYIEVRSYDELRQYEVFPRKPKHIEPASIEGSGDDNNGTGSGYHEGRSMTKTNDENKQKLTDDKISSEDDFIISYDDDEGKK